MGIPSHTKTHREVELSIAHLLEMQTPKTAYLARQSPTTKVRDTCCRTLKTWSAGQSQRSRPMPQQTLRLSSAVASSASMRLLLTTSQRNMYITTHIATHHITVTATASNTMVMAMAMPTTENMLDRRDQLANEVTHQFSSQLIVAVFMCNSISFISQKQKNCSNCL